VAGADGLVALAFAAPDDPPNEPWLARRFGRQPLAPGEHPALDAVAGWLEGYFAGKPADPREVPVALVGSAFERQVWQALYAIPYGATTSYGAIAERLGLPKGGARAIGGAVGTAVGTGESDGTGNGPGANVGVAVGLGDSPGMWIEPGLAVDSATGLLVFTLTVAPKVYQKPA